MVFMVDGIQLNTEDINKTQKNNIVIDNTLPKILNDYLNYISTIKGRTDNTVKTYKTDLVMFLQFMKAYKSNLNNIELNNVDITDITVKFIKSINLKDIHLYMNFLQQKDNTANTRCKKISSLKSFYKYLQKMELIEIEENAVMNLEKPTVRHKEVDCLNLQQVKQLLNTMNNYNYDYNYQRDYAIIMLILNCGLRRDEIHNLNLNNIKNNQIVVLGKGEKERTIDLNDKTKKAIQQWIIKRNTMKINNNNENAVFISQKGNRIEDSSINNLIKKWTNKAGLKNVTTHKLRHTCATLMIKAGENIRTIQTILGHENISTTQIYTHIDDKDKKNAIQNNPINSL